LPSLTAYWVGLLYDDDALNACWDMVKSWTAAERQKLRDDVPPLGFKAEIRDRNVFTLAQETLRLCSRGLARRKRFDRNGWDETRYLRPLEESIARGITPAEELLEKFHGEWNDSVEPIFDEYAY
jgi:glutamate--cysteine ligase